MKWLGVISTMLRKILSGSFIVLLLSGCYEEPAEPKQMGLITGEWRRTSWTSNPAYSYTFSDGTRKSYTNLFDLYLPCAHDNEYIFDMNPKADYGGFGTYIYQEGKVACGATSILELGKWSVTASGSGIHMYFEEPDSEYPNIKLKRLYKVEELTQNKLIFTYQLSSGQIWREEYVRVE